MKRIILPTLLMLMGLYASYAQEIEDNAAVREILDKMYGNLDKEKVPTGLLLDYAFDLVDFDRYDGSGLSDSNFVERSTFECLLRSVRSAAVAAKPFKDVTSVMEDMSKESGNTINIGLLLFKYNYIREDALEKNLIKYENDMVYDCYDKYGNWINPYAEKFVIGFSSFSYISELATVNIAFPSEFIFSNAAIEMMEFDAGDGNGFVTVTPGGSRSVSYNAGTKELKMRVTLASGEVLVCHSQLICSHYKVQMNSQSTSEGSKGDDDKPDVMKDFYYTSGGKPIKARASIFYAASNEDKSIKKPFVYVEGFDPVELKELCIKMGMDSNDSTYNAEYDSGFTTARKKCKIIKKANENIINDYDIIYIDWLNCEADIRDNARLLMQIIEWINTEKIGSDSNEPNIVLGESMGGLIARYALRKMELEGKPHETTAYISHDTPHLGAHVPLGALYGIHGLLIYYYNGGIAVDIAKLALKAGTAGHVLRKYLHSASAKQMLVNHVNTLGFIDNAQHNEWQKELAVMGFPAGDPGVGITNLAAANGGKMTSPVQEHYVTVDGIMMTSGFGDWLVPPILSVLGPLFNVPPSVSGILPGRTRLSCHLEINPYSEYRTKIFDMSIRYNKRILWFINKNITVFARTYYSPSSGLMYDYFSGSTYSYCDSGDKSHHAFSFWIGGFGYNLGFYSKEFMFIPTASALCYGNGESLSASDYNRNFYASQPKPLVEMPFHDIFLVPDASGHIYVMGGMYTWIEQQVAVEVTGPQMPVTGDKYTLKGCIYPVTWSSSDPSVVSVNSSTGIVTVKGSGYVTLTAKYTVLGKEYSKKKSILAGFPELYVVSYFDKDKGYLAEAKCRYGMESLSAFVENGSISYEWGLKYGEEPIQWQTSSSKYFLTGLARPTETTTVYVRLRAANGSKGKTCSHVLETYYPNSYYVTPKCFVLDKAGLLYSIDPKSMPRLIAQEDLPLRISYSIYTHDKPDYNLPRKIIVNQEDEFYWTALPQPDVSVWMLFPLMTNDELFSLLEQMKPSGELEKKVLWVSAYDTKGVEVHLAPIYFLYMEDFTENTFWTDLPLPSM